MDSLTSSLSNQLQRGSGRDFLQSPGLGIGQVGSSSEFESELFRAQNNVAGAGFFGLGEQTFDTNILSGPAETAAQTALDGAPVGASSTLAPDGITNVDRAISSRQQQIQAQINRLIAEQRKDGVKGGLPPKLAEDFNRLTTTDSPSDVQLAQYSQRFYFHAQGAYYHSLTAEGQDAHVAQQHVVTSVFALSVVFESYSRQVSSGSLPEQLEEAPNAGEHIANLWEQTQSTAGELQDMMHNLMLAMLQRRTFKFDPNNDETEVNFENVPDEQYQSFRSLAIELSFKYESISAMQIRNAAGVADINDSSDDDTLEDTNLADADTAPVATDDTETVA